MRLSNVNTRRLLELKYELVCSFELVTHMVGGGTWEFVNDARTSIPGKGADGIWCGWVPVGQNLRLYK